MKDSISVIIPAYNEEHSLKDAVIVAINVLSDICKEYEIIIVNDGSTDATGKIATLLAKKNRKIKVIHHKDNEGFGKTFNDGLAIASKKYVTGFPADNDIFTETFRNLLLARKSDRIVSSYMITMSRREIIRQIISYSFSTMMNLIFGLKLKYYNGYFICPLHMVKTLKLASSGFTIFAEIKIRLINKGVKIDEIPFEYKPRPHGVSKALALKNILQTLSFIPVLIADVYVPRSSSNP